MTHQIFKYKCDILTGPFFLHLPKDARIISVQLQRRGTMDDGPQLWAIVNASNDTERREFVWFATGFDLFNPQLYTYIESLQVDEFVFHLFEVKGASNE